MGGDGDREAPLVEMLAGSGFAVTRDSRIAFDAVLHFGGGTMLEPLTVEAGDVRIDLITRQVKRSGRRIALSPREFDIIACLARRRGAAVGRPALLAEIWGYRFDPGTNLIAVHVSRLRAKLGSAIIETVGSGYRLAAA